FRPLSSLEIGLSRTAQWCGEGRPCDLGTFADLLAGRDNVGDQGIETGNEPGNQLAGVDLRWSLARFRLPVAVYGQFIGEDEAGGFPSRYLAQVGVEGTGSRGERWSYRWFGEIADTSCGFYESNNFNCAYNHGIYRTGYRYRGRAIGHGADNDARLLSFGVMLIDDAATRWNLLARYGELNRGGAPDVRHTLTPVPADIASIDLSWSRGFRCGVIEIGAGAEHTDDTNLRGYLQWRSAQ
ncbi:MAG TPA: capsule assembly Wzi family protein, partial [Woeseiaceae bacterium]|nr:capsule assembly Wzi family protein [Woeseiaceae bacterium]